MDELELLKTLTDEELVARLLVASNTTLIERLLLSRLRARLEERDMLKSFVGNMEDDSEEETGWAPTGT
jgi:hypothetical protein